MLKKLNKNVDKFIFYFLPVNILREVKVTQDMVDTMLEMRSNLIQAIQTNEFESSTKITKCRWCVYRWYCDKKLVGDKC